MWTNTNTEQDLIEGILKHGPDILAHCICTSDLSKYTSRINQEKLPYPIPPSEIDPSEWFIPKEYQELDIEAWILENCPPEHQSRVVGELELYHSHNMIMVLRAMKYIVDTLRKNNIIWGVGRGSSVASYVLYLIGVHKVDSIKYNLPIEEFFKEK